MTTSVNSSVGCTAPVARASSAAVASASTASSMRTQDMLFAILKELADSEVEITGQGVLEVLTDGFGFLRSPESNYLPGPGSKIGAALVEHPDVALIAFTGSRAVGLAIHAKAA